MPHFRNIPRRQSRHLTKQEDDIYNLDLSLSSSTMQAAMDGATYNSLSGSSLGTSYLGSIGPDRIYQSKSTGRRRDEAPYYREASVTSEDFSDYSPPLPPSRARIAHSRRKPDNHIPRPRNAFIFFRSHFYQQRELGGDKSAHQNDVSRDAGVVWRNLSKEERKPFQDLAAREKLEHREKFPDYVYTPGGIRGSSRRRKSKSSTQAKKRKVSASSSRPNTRKATVEPKSKPSTPVSTLFDDIDDIRSTSYMSNSPHATPVLSLSLPSPASPQFEYPEFNVEQAAKEYEPKFALTPDTPLELLSQGKKENKPDEGFFGPHPVYRRMNTCFGYDPSYYSESGDISLSFPQLEHSNILDFESYYLGGHVTPEGLLTTPINYEISSSFDQKPIFTDPWSSRDITSPPGPEFDQLADQFTDFEAYDKSR